MKRKRVVFMTNSLARGGAERVLSRIIPRLEEWYEIYLVLIDGSKIEFECPVNIIKLGGAEKKNRVLYLLDQIAAKRKLEKFLKDYHVECVISFLDVPNLINLLTSTNCKKIVSVRGSASAKFKDKVKAYLYKKMTHRIDAVVSVSDALRRNIIAQWHVDSAKVVTIENPYDIVEINALAKEKMGEAETAFYAAHRVIVAAGRLVKEKGYIYLLDSFCQVLADKKDVGLVIVGDGGERKSLEDRARQLGIEKSIMFCGMKENPFPYIKAAEIFVLSSISEGFPNVLVEAMCCGRPVIACDCVTGPREILYAHADLDVAAEKMEFADYGILVPDFTERNHMNITEKEQLLAKAINTLLENDDLRYKYTKRAYERAEYYSYERCINKYIEIID